MKRSLQTISCFLFSLIFTFLFVVPQVHAFSISQVPVKGENDFVLEPGKAEFYLDPGQTVTKDIYITNRTDHDVSFKVQLEDFVGSTDPQTPVVLLDGDSSPYSFKDNLKPEVELFTLKSGQKISLPVQVVVPKNQAPGGYYSSVLISNEPTVNKENQADTTAGQTKTISRLGVLFFVRVNGLADVSAKVEDFRIKGPKQLFYQQGPFNFEILFNNTGSVHLVPYGTIDIQNTFGKSVQTLPIDAYFSLPHSTRYRDVKWDSGFLFGRYTAHLKLNMGYDQIVEEKNITIWVLPWKYIIIFVLVVFIIFSLFYYIRSNFEFKRK